MVARAGRGNGRWASRDEDGNEQENRTSGVREGRGLGSCGGGSGDARAGGAGEGGQAQRALYHERPAQRAGHGVLGQRPG